MEFILATNIVFHAVSIHANHPRFSLCVELSRGVLNGAMTEFQEKLRQQHENSMHKELENLLSTAKGAEAEVGLHKQSVTSTSSREVLHFTFLTVHSFTLES